MGCLSPLRSPGAGLWIRHDVSDGARWIGPPLSSTRRGWASGDFFFTAAGEGECSSLFLFYISFFFFFILPPKRIGFFRARRRSSFPASRPTRSPFLLFAFAEGRPGHRAFFLFPQSKSIPPPSSSRPVALLSSINPARPRPSLPLNTRPRRSRLLPQPAPNGACLF